MLGSYKLHEVIGEGGMGIVYLATHARLGRRVAIKMLRSHYTNNPQAVHRFFAEARSVNKIHHSNIVQITDFIEQVGDDNYYVMELLEGKNLARAMATSGVLPLSRTIGIMMQVASVVEAVHRAGIVHRDLKPDNVFLTERGGQQDFVKLVDFGVAKLIDDNDDFVSTHNTNPGSILGTPDYMSPEQASATAVDHRTDIYAFGAMLYEMVTGRLPLTGGNFGEIVVQLMTVTPTAPRALPDLPHEIPEALDELIMSCLAKQTIDRPDSMETIAEKLGEIADEQGWIVYELNVRASGPTYARADSRASGEHTPLPRALPSKPMPPLPKPAPDPAQKPAADAQPKPAPEPPAPKHQSLVVEPAPLGKGDMPTPPRRRRMWPLAAAGGAVLAGVVAFALVRGSHRGNETAAKVATQLRIADERIASGKLVAPGGDDALEHLVEARRLDPANTAVAERLHVLAREYEQLADQARTAGSLAEAAAHLQVVITAEPDNKAAATKMQEVEAAMLARQRAPH